MNLIIIAAIVIAAAGIAGMLILAREHANLFVGFAHLSGEAFALRQSVAQGEGKLAIAKTESRATTELATQLAHEARALEAAVKAKDAEIERLAKTQPRYGRDAKGRFSRIAA